jgi:hypothetical protein
VHRLVRELSVLLEHGVRPERILPVVNRAPRPSRARAEITRTIAALTASVPGRTSALPSPVYLPDVRRIDANLRDGASVPGSISSALTAAVNAIAARADALPAAHHDDEPIAVVPGSLGSWSTSQEAAG